MVRRRQVENDELNKRLKLLAVFLCRAAITAAAAAAVQVISYTGLRERARRRVVECVPLLDGARQRRLTAHCYWECLHVHGVSVSIRRVNAFRFPLLTSTFIRWTPHAQHNVVPADVLRSERLLIALRK